ncbi:MAG: class I SAM-dependent methyltransferase [Ktedonobacteraceae bacterium]
MQDSGNVFRTGKYHKSFGKKNIHPVRKALLRFFYHTCSHLIDKLGWPDPLAKNAPQILLCGTASPYTTVTFARFVSERNCAANIDVLDISPYALSQSENLLKTCQDIDGSKMRFVEGDALHMPLPGARFDWIETDFFMQYFSAQEKAILFQEWYRVLKPGGVITTRDWLWQRQNFSERVVDRTKNWLIKRILGPIARSAKLLEIQQLLHDAGFDVAFFPVSAPIIHVRIPLMSYIIVHKPSL